MNGNQSESLTERIKGTQILRNQFNLANINQLGYENDDKPYRPSSSYLDKKFKINVDIKEYPEESTSKPDLGDTQCNTFNSLSDSVTKKYQINCRLPVENEKRSRRFFKEKPPINTSIGSDIDIPLIDEVIKKISHSTKSANTFRHSSKCELRTYSNRRKVPLNIPDKPILESFGLPDESIIQVNDSLSALDLPIAVNLCSTQILDSSWSQNFSNSEVVNIEHFDLPSVIFKSRLTSSETESSGSASFCNGSVAKSNVDPKFGRLKKSSSQLKDVSDEEEKFQTKEQKNESTYTIKTGNFKSNLGSNDRNDERLYSSLVMSKKEKGENNSQSLNLSKGRKSKSSSKISIESHEGKTDMVNPNVSKRLELKILLNPLIITDYVDKSIKCNININQDIGTSNHSSNQSLHKRGNNTFQRGLRSKSTTLGNLSHLARCDKSTNKEVPNHKKHANGKLPKHVKDDLESAFYSSQSFDLNKKKTLQNAKEQNKSNSGKITNLPTCRKITASKTELDQKESIMKINERIGVSSNTRRVSPRHLPINFNATWPVNSITMKNRIKKNFSNIVRKPSTSTDMEKTALHTIEEIQVARYSQDNKSFSSADAENENNIKRSSKAVKSMSIQSLVDEKLAGTNMISTKDGSPETVISKINTDFMNRLVQIKLRKCDDISSPLFKKFSDLDCSPLRRSPRNSIQLDHKTKLITTETGISDIEDSGSTSAIENRHSVKLTVEKTIKIQKVRERDSQICLGVERIDQRRGTPRRSPRNSVKNGELPTTLLTKNSIADNIEDISSEDNKRSIISEILEKNSVRGESQNDTSKFNLLHSYTEVVSQKYHEPFKSDSGEKETLIEVNDQSKGELFISKFALEKDKFGRSMEDKNHLDPLRRSLRHIPKSFNKVEDGMENVDNKEQPEDDELNSIQIKKKLDPDEFVDDKSKTILFQALMKEIIHVAIPPLNDIQIESQTEQPAEQISPQFKSINIRHSGRKITLINNKTGFKSEAKEFKIEQNETLPTDTLMKFDQQIQQNGMIEFSLVKKSGMETNSPEDLSSNLSTFEDCDTPNFPEKKLLDCDKEQHLSLSEIEQSPCDNYIERDSVKQHEGDMQIVKKITSDFVERFETFEESFHEENEQIGVYNDSLRRSQRLSYGRLGKKKVESNLLNNSKTALLANGDINKHKRKSVLNPPKDETVFSTQKNGELSNVSSKEINTLAKNDVASLNPVNTVSRNESSEMDTLETKKSILDLEQNIILDNVSTIILKKTEDEISSSKIASLNKQNSKCPKDILKKSVCSDISLESIDIDCNVGSLVSPKTYTKDEDIVLEQEDLIGKGDKKMIKQCNKDKLESSVGSSNLQSHSKEHVSSQIVSLNSKQKCPKSILKKRVSSDISIESVDIEINVGYLASPKKLDRNLESSRNEDFVLKQEHLIEKNDKEMIQKCNREKMEVSIGSSNVQSHSEELVSSQIVSLNKENCKQKCPKSILKKRVSSDISIESIDNETNVGSLASPKKVDRNLESSRNESFVLKQEHLIEKNDKEMITVSVGSSNVQSHSGEHVSSQIVSLNKENSKQKCPKSILKKRVSSDIFIESIDIETNVESLACPKKVDRNLESSRNEDFVLKQEHLIEKNDKEMIKKFNREKSEVSVGSSNVQSPSDERSQEIGIFNNFVLTENEVSPIKKPSKFLSKIHPYDEAGEARRKSLRSRVPRSKSLNITKEGNFEDDTNNKVVSARIFNSSVDDKMLICDNDADSKRLRSKSECRSALRINVNELCRTRRSRSRKRRPLKIMNSANVNSDEIEQNYIKNDHISDEKTQSLSEVSASNVKIEENVDSSCQSQGEDTIIERNRKRSKSANSGLKILRRSSRIDRKVDASREHPIQQPADSKQRRNKKKEENLQDINGDVSNDLCESNEELEVIPIHIITGVSLNDELIPSSFEDPETVTVLHVGNISGEEPLNASTEKMVEVEVIFDEVPKNFPDVRYTDTEMIVLSDHVLDNLATERLNENEIELKCEPNTVKGGEHTQLTNQTVDDNAIEISKHPITPSTLPGIEYDSFEDHSNSIKDSKPRPKSVVPFVTDSSCEPQNFSEDSSGKPEVDCPSYLKEYLDVGYDIHRRRSFRKILQNVIEISKIEMQFNEIEARKARSKSVPHERQKELKRTFTISEGSDVWKKPRKNKTSLHSEGKKNTPTTKEKSRISLVSRTNLKKTQLFKDDVTIQKPYEIANNVCKVDEVVEKVFVDVNNPLESKIGGQVENPRDVEAKIFESPHKGEKASALIGSELGKVTRSKSKSISANWKVQSMQESDQKPCVLDSLDSNFSRKTMSPCDRNEAASDTAMISSDLGQIKKGIQESTTKMTKAQRFPEIDSQGKRSFKVGDLVWGKIGRNPYWPCLVVREPGTKLYKKITDMWRNCFTLYHVRFFGDKGRRAWTKHVIPYTSRNDLNALSMKAVSENSSSKTFIQENYHIKQALTNKWQKAIEEADSLLSKTIKDKLKFFFNMFANADEKNKRRVRRKLKIASEEDGQNELLPGRLNEARQEPGLISTKRKRHSQEIPLKAKRSKTDDVVLEKRNDLSPQKSKTDAKKVKSQSPNDDKPVNLFSPKKLRSKSNTPLDCHLSDTESKISGNSSSQASLESQAALYRRNNIFKGVLRDKVCQFCEKPDDILKCRGPCIGNYHLKCAEKLLKQFQHGRLKSEIVEEVTKEQTVGIGDVDETLFDESTKEPTFDSKEPNVQIITIRSKLTPPPFSLALSPNIKKMSISEQIDRKMKEIMNQIDTEHSYPEPTDSSSDETPYDDAEARSEKITPQELRELMSKPMVMSKVANDESKTSKKVKKSTFKQSATNVFKHVTADDVSIVNITSAGKLVDTAGANTSSKSTNVVLSEDNFKCAFCTMSTEPYCFVCKQETSKKGNDARQKCSLFKCGRYYHLECLKTWPQTQWSFVLNPKVKVNNALDSFVCPVHVCHMCASEDPGISLGHCSNDKLVKCLRCPATYHNTSYCVPAGTEIITSTQIICPRHVSKKQFTLNTIWCFICSEGGNLICCENCPTSVHVECLPTNPSAEDVFICDDCETGRYPLYDEIVWVKLGNYRWWPALVLFPNEVPDNVRNKAHGRGEFVVKFFGTYDYHWVGRGRSFLYQEGDKGHLTNCKSKIDSAFAKAIDEAACAHRLKTEFKVTKESKINNGLKPPPYVRIKVNRPVGNVRMFDGNLSNTTSCDCDPKQPNPCGPDSDCLNRLLLTECNPEVCSAKKNCLNQSFEKREYPPLLPYKTQSRGWGLKTLAPIKKGQFVIEYVGEMIDDDEYQRRILKMHQQKDENYYFLTIDKDRMLDAGPKGNVARFMNHSCQPNCETQKWTVNGDTRVGLFATDDIPTDAELTFNYNLECVGKEKKICKCGAANCSGFIGAKPEGASKKSRSYLPKTKKKKESEGSGVEVIRNVPCFVCGKFTGVGACNNKNCNNYYHLKCVGLDSWPDGSKWTCSWHNCNICTKRTIRCCTKCTNSYCPSHSEGYIRYDDLLGFICTIHDETKTTRRRLKKKATLKFGTSSINKNLKVSSREFRIDCKNTSTPMKKNVPLQVKTSSGPIRTSPLKKTSISSLTIKGSPKKTKSRLLNVSEDSTASSGSRKRGRPRKVIANPNLNFSVESTSSDPVKRKPGRPKKVSCTSLNNSKESGDFGSVKRKRGRPRKEHSSSILNDSTEMLPSDVKIIDQGKPTSGTMDESIDLVTSESRTRYPVEFNVEINEISTDSKEEESCKRIKLDENVNGIGVVGVSDVAKELIVSHVNCEGVSRLNGKLEAEEITESKIGTQKS